MARERSYLRVFEDLEELSASAARTLVECANDAVRRRGLFALALSGGGTPKTLRWEGSDRREARVLQADASERG